mmetsp:Transcript_5408/g.10304  ORF Transcript_5408/g.10304 Transcript_5408/m.10304 type:complete len:903 (+) Transcript_5408:57-2765(+)
MSSFSSPSSSSSTPASAKKKSRTRQRNRTPSKTADGTGNDTPKGTAKGTTKGTPRGTPKDNPKSNSGGKGKGSSRRNNANNNTPGSGSRRDRPIYEDHVSQQDLPTYCQDSKVVIYGKFRGVTTSRRSGYVTPSRPPAGLYSPPSPPTPLAKDVYVEGDKRKNRVIDGEYCYVEVDASCFEAGDGDDQAVVDLTEEMEAMEGAGGKAQQRVPWSSDRKQFELWSPQHDTLAPLPMSPLPSTPSSRAASQVTGKVVSVVPSPTPITVVGVLKPNPNGKGVLLYPVSNKLPAFYLPPSVSRIDVLARGTYNPGSWGTRNYFPRLSDVQIIGNCVDVEAETEAALRAEGIEHTASFPAPVEACVLRAVSAGRTEQGWSPTPSEALGRRDFTQDCVFTIDPTTARDLDDALCISPLSDGSGVLCSVHIADVTAFVKPKTSVDDEARVRCTTVYMVDRVIPMLPRDLCEIACSLNEGVTRLSFSCQFELGHDGGLKSDKNGRRKVWYGRGVIRSKCRLDYRTAQNIIEGKCGNGSDVEDDEYWPLDRRPVDGATREDVARSVRLMHGVAMRRRKRRFESGAVGLTRVKLAFKMAGEAKVPEKCEPYPIWDSNRVVEEFMLLANFLVAERLIVKGEGAGLLRRHEQPTQKGLTEVKEMAVACGVDIDISTSESLQRTLNAFTKRAAATGDPDDDLKLQAITSMLTSPFQPAEYFIASEVDQNEYHHYALNIPYYTHFTSPIRRYADCVVHRVLQATLDGSLDEYREENGKDAEVFIAERCNEMKTAAKRAQERSDRVFLSIYLKHNPVAEAMGVVVGVGEKSFTVLVPEVGAEGRVYLDDQREKFNHKLVEDGKGGKTIKVGPTEKHRVEAGLDWQNLDVKLFQKVRVAVTCKEEMPVDIKVWLVGPY